MFFWRPISEAPKDASLILLGRVNSLDMDFYRYIEALREGPDWKNWCDCCSDPPSEEPTHFMEIDPPKE
jgi:hypothetical protein